MQLKVRFSINARCLWLLDHSVRGPALRDYLASFPFGSTHSLPLKHVLLSHRCLLILMQKLKLIIHKRYVDRSISVWVLQVKNWSKGWWIRKEHDAPQLAEGTPRRSDARFTLRFCLLWVEVGGLKSNFMVSKKTGVFLTALWSANETSFPAIPKGAGEGCSDWEHPTEICKYFFPRSSATVLAL